MGVSVVVSGMKCRALVGSVVMASSFLWISAAWMTPAYAQANKVVEPTSAQIELNEAGIQAILDKDYALAVQLFDSSLALGPINITYVNRGRAYQHAGKCEEADASYEAAYSAPVMTEPSAANIAATIERYRAEMMETCPGKLVLECEPRELHVTVDGKPLGACPEDAIALTRGEHSIRGELMGQTVETVVDISPMRVRRLALRLDGSNAHADNRGAGGKTDGELFQSVQPLADDGRSLQAPRSRTGAYLALGSGAALVLGGAAFELMDLESSNNGKFDAIDMTSTVLFTAGGVLAVYGLMSLFN